MFLMTVVFFLFNCFVVQRSVGYKAGFLPGSPMAFHVYCITGTDGPGPVTPIAKDICHFNDNFQIKVRREDLKRLNTPGFVTEFGAVEDVATGLAEVRFVADHLDGGGTGMPLSWVYWVCVVFFRKGLSFIFERCFFLTLMFDFRVPMFRMLQITGRNWQDPTRQLLRAILLILDSMSQRVM